MKNLIFLFVYLISAIAIFPQSMVIQKTDGTNLFMDMNTIETINFIIPCPGIPTVDYGGKTYNTILIGNQCWLKENLDIGTMVSGGINQTSNAIIEKYCYNNVLDSCTKYGGLYQWDEAMQYSSSEGAPGICPEGWHIPTEVEVQTLKTNVSNNGNELKREDQGSGVGEGTNVSGFSALLAGGRLYSGSSFVGFGDTGWFWISKKGLYGYSYNIRLPYNEANIYIDAGSIPSWGFSIRCIQN